MHYPSEDVEAQGNFFLHPLDTLEIIMLISSGAPRGKIM
jgi:hypothetical protein